MKRAARQGEGGKGNAEVLQQCGKTPAKSEYSRMREVFVCMEVFPVYGESSTHNHTHKHKHRHVVFV
jgi:hypothetical protein